MASRQKYFKKYRERNKIKLDKYKKKYYQEHKYSISIKDKERYKKNRIRILFQKKESNANRKEKIRDYNKKYRKKNESKIKEYRKGYNKTHKQHNTYFDKFPEKRNEYERNRRARKRNSFGKINSDEWLNLKKKFGYTCLCCGKQEPEIKLTLDHVVPLKLGGENTISNAQPLCMPCNSGKGIQIIDYRKTILGQNNG